MFYIYTQSKGFTKASEDSENNLGKSGTNGEDEEVTFNLIKPFAAHQDRCSSPSFFCFFVLFASLVLCLFFGLFLFFLFFCCLVSISVFFSVFSFCHSFFRSSIFNPDFFSSFCYSIVCSFDLSFVHPFSCSSIQSFFHPFFRPLFFFFFFFF